MSLHQGALTNPSVGPLSQVARLTDPQSQQATSAATTYGHVLFISGMGIDAMGSEAMAMRELYSRGLEGISSQARDMLSAGKSEEQVARSVVSMRNQLKIQIREQGPALFKKIAELRNMNEYNDFIGPTYEDLRVTKTDQQIIAKLAGTSEGFDAVGGALRVGGVALEATGFILMATQNSPDALEPLPQSDEAQVEIERVRLRYGIPAGANIDRHGHLKPGFYMQVDMFDPHIENETNAETEEILWFLGEPVTYTYGGVKWTVPGR